MLPELNQVLFYEMALNIGLTVLGGIIMGLGINAMIAYLARGTQEATRTDPETGDHVVEYSRAATWVGVICTVSCVGWTIFGFWVALDAESGNKAFALPAFFFLGVLLSLYILLESRGKIYIWDHGFKRIHPLFGKQEYLWTNVVRYGFSGALMYHYIYFSDGSRIAMSAYMRGLDKFFDLLEKKRPHILHDRPDQTP